ncbi:class I SAM-dependent methyltransferase [Bacillus sp. CGMCC 1.16541]|uniref:class I SAM-dependent methyltransferase n=1 Tax=Bacillus sp. CGMCC 1.16541 TaxID=2185143 RepID=UPI000D733293|nr:class I SAM-dependent methyltransferase [Bacillus sp. CGMCC 1.16541]
MGREFLNIFEDWASEYDASVHGHDEEYKEVFNHYDDILQTVANLAKGNVLEFGVGTGNLTTKLLASGKSVYGVEPSQPMRELAIEKLGKKIKVEDGDFLQFEVPVQQIDSVVSTYAFHHLTDEEKQEAIVKYGNLLETGGKIVFADTMFESKKAFEDTIEQAKANGYHNLAEDLQREYYTTIDVLRTSFEENGFEVTFSRFNHFVWVVDATKK